MSKDPNEVVYVPNPNPYPGVPKGTPTTGVPVNPMPPRPKGK